MVSSTQRSGWALLLFCLIDIVAANSDRCQKTVSLDLTSGNISEPLYTNTSLTAGIRSCWLLSHPTSQDYFTAIHIELVDFVAFFDTTNLDFSGLGTPVRLKPTPSCILYDNANCEISGAVTEMARHFPECEYSFTYVRMNGSAPRVLLNSGSNTYQEWKNGTLKFNLQYVQFNCSDVNATKESISHANQGCIVCSCVSKLPATIAAVILGVALICTLIALTVIVRRRRVAPVTAAPVDVRLSTENDINHVAEDAEKRPPPGEQSYDALYAPEQQTESATYAAVVPNSPRGALLEENL